MFLKNIVRRNSYADSVFLMSLANRAAGLPGILEASALMGTPENKDLLRDAGLLTEQGQSAHPDDLILALRAETQEQTEAAFQQIQEWMTRRLTAAPRGEEQPPRTLRSAFDRMPDARVVLISIPGRYVAWEAQTALEAGRQVMIFSDNVPVKEEVALKALAAERGLMVMGPDCGTAVLGGKVLGFGNAVRPGHIGIVGASGTGIQEACSLLDRFDEGISHAIGLGGRDLSEIVGGAAALQAIRLLESDADTEILLFISKPPDPAVAGRVVNALSGLKKPCVVCFQGGAEPKKQRPTVTVLPYLEAAVMRVLHFKAKQQDFLKYQLDFQHRLQDRFASETVGLKAEQRYIRGLFSGGSLCAEAGVLFKSFLPDLFTNISLPGARRLDKGSVSRGHTLVDLGADEFTVGVPHPMIDFTVRNRRLIQEANDPGTAVILFDIVLGYGAHPDPAGAILPAVLEAKRTAGKRRGQLCCVAALCGTRGDPQGLDDQRQKLEDQGVIVLPSTVQAARFAVHVALRGQEQAREGEIQDFEWPVQKVEMNPAPPPERGLLDAPLKVINLGLPAFADSLRQQEVEVVHVGWQPPAGGDGQLLEVLRKLR